MLSLIGCFCHKDLFFRPFPDRKRITKTSYCKDDSYEMAKGEGSHSGGQELRYSRPNLPFLHNWDRLRTYRVWFPGWLSALSFQ